MKKKSYSNRFPQTEYKLTYLKKKSYVCNNRIGEEQAKVNNQKEPA
uniref:Uncharacterized protein n=1 Tax=Myoviridae sp. ctino4 TaxID=2826686 RepID=A0A8S5MTK2_9CAUD|nr:MAG TPA: hypothetical protein [Myoviridae sp. ctino4]